MSYPAPVPVDPSCDVLCGECSGLTPEQIQELLDAGVQVGCCPYHARKRRFEDEES